MITTRPISLNCMTSFKAVRLAALRDAPLAFGSTFAKESSFSDAQWADRIEKWCGKNSICYLAWDADQPCGIVAGLVDQSQSAAVALVSMWVAPSHRRRGVGRLLVDGIVEWARDRHAVTVYLSVTSVNDGASRFYEQLGFRKTGKTEPYPNDASLVEYEMRRPVNLVS